MKQIDTEQLQNNPAHSSSDKELIEALLKVHHICLDGSKAHFKQYESHVEKWFTNIPPETKK